MLCSFTLTLATVLAEMRKLKSSLDERKYLECDEVDQNDNNLGNSIDHINFLCQSYHSAEVIQKQVKDIEKQRRQDTSHNDNGKSRLNVSLEGASQLVPNDLYNHLAWLMHCVTYEIERDGSVALSKKQHEEVLNISQDIIAAISSTPTPKQMGA